MAKKKTPEELADLEYRYTLARDARTAEQFEELSRDSNQGVRAAAAHNPNAPAPALELFAGDRSWGVRIEVANHPNATHEIIMSLLEPDPRKQGVVHHAAHKRLVADGVAPDDLPSP